MLNTDIFNANRLLWHGARLAQWQDGLNPYPIAMDLHLTGACNLRCPRCSGGERKGSLSSELVYDLLRQLREGDVRGIIYTGGGEPTMHQDFSKIIRYTKELGFSIGLITNGSLLTDEIMETISACNAWVRVSLDSYNEESYNKNYGVTGDNFQTVCKNIAKLVDIKKKLKSKCTVGVGYLVDDVVIPGMVSASERVKEYGVDYIQFRQFESFTSYPGRLSALETKDYVRFDFEKFALNLKECRALATDDFRVTCHEYKFKRIGEAAKGIPVKPPSYSGCHGSQFTGAITATGDVCICCVLKGYPEYTFGNVNEKSFHKIWDSKRRKEVMKNLKIARDCVPFCRCDRMNSFLEPLTRKMLHVDFL